MDKNDFFTAWIQGKRRKTQFQSYYIVDRPNASFMMKHTVDSKLLLAIHEPKLNLVYTLDEIPREICRSANQMVVSLSDVNYSSIDYVNQHIHLWKTVDRLTTGATIVKIDEKYFLAAAGPTQNSIITAKDFIYLDYAPDPNARVSLRDTPYGAFKERTESLLERIHRKIEDTTYKYGTFLIRTPYASIHQLYPRYNPKIIRARPVPENYFISPGYAPKTDYTRALKLESLHKVPFMDEFVRDHNDWVTKYSYMLKPFLYGAKMMELFGLATTGYAIVVNNKLYTNGKITGRAYYGENGLICDIFVEVVHPSFPENYMEQVGVEFGYITQS